MTVALMARQAAHYNTEESFNYYIDPSAGSDSNPGTKASPFASLSHAFTVGGANKAYGLKAGTTYRPASALSLPGASVRVGCYGCLPGAPNMPIVSGGTVVAGWTEGPGSATDQYVSAGSAGSTSPACGPTGTTTDANEVIIAALGAGLTSGTLTKPSSYNSRVNAVTGDGTVGLADQIVTSEAAFSATWTLSSSANWDTLIQTFTAAAGAMFVQALNSGTQLSSVTSGSVSVGALTTVGHTVIAVMKLTTGNTLSSVTDSKGNLWTVINGVTETGSKVAIAYALLTTALTTSDTVTVTASASGNIVVGLVEYSGITYTANPIYNATLASTPAYVAFTSGSTVTPLTQGSSATALTTNQWYYTGGKLYVNLGGTAPSTGTVEAATTKIIYDNTAGHDGFVARGVSFRFGADQVIALEGNHGHVLDRSEWCYTGYVANSGSVLLANYNNASIPPYFTRITRCSMHDLQNDGGWNHNFQNLQIDHCTIANIGALAGDVQSDGWQTEDTFVGGTADTAPNCSGLWIHHNTVTMGSYTPKGCLIYNAWAQVGAVSSALVERNTLTGGNYGVAAAASNMITRYNTMINQVSAFGGGVHVDISGTLITGQQIYGNTVIDSGHAGVIVQQTTNPRTGFLIANNTVYNCAYRGVMIAAPCNGGITENNLVWNSSAVTRTSAGIWMDPDALAGSPSFVMDYNDWGPTTVGGNFVALWNGTNCATLAALQAASAMDAHSISADPLFNNPTGNDFSLQGGSPAKSTGGAVTGPAGPTIWGVAIPAFVVAAGADIGAI